MESGVVTVRPVRLTDAPYVRENCFVMNALEGVQSRIEANLQAFEQGNGVPLVNEVDAIVVGTVLLTRHAHLLEAHRAESAGSDKQKR